MILESEGRNIRVAISPLALKSRNCVYLYIFGKFIQRVIIFGLQDLLLIDFVVIVSQIFILIDKLVVK